MPPFPPPLLQTRVRGGHFNLVATFPPSLTSNASWRGHFNLVSTFSPSLASNASRRGSLHLHPPPVPPPSLQTRVGGGVLSFDQPRHHLATHPSPSLQTRVGESRRHLFPLPCFKRESENLVSTFSPSLISNASRRGHFNLVATFPPSLASNVSRRGHLNLVATFSPSLASNVRGILIFRHHLFPLPRFEHESEGAF